MGDVRRISKAGKFIGWYIRYKDVDGKRKQRASKQPSKELARRMLVEIEARVARGLVGVPEQAPIAPTLDRMIARFLEEYQSPKIKDLTRYRALAAAGLRRVQSAIGDKPIDQLTKRDVERARNALAAEYRANTVRSSFGFLSAMLSWAIKEGHLEKSVTHGVDMPRMERSLEYLASAEVKALLGLVAERARRANKPRPWVLYVGVMLSLRLGLRRGEIFGLRWQDLSADAKLLTVARSYRVVPKSNKARHLPLPVDVAQLLQDWRKLCPKTAEGLVCPIYSRGIWRMPGSRGDHGLGGLLEKVGIAKKQRPWHCLRHTFASHYMMQGGNILALQRMLGHSDLKMTMLYAHLGEDYLSREMDRLKY